MRADHSARLRQETVDMFYHGWNNYMKHAFPEDEVCPLHDGQYGLLGRRTDLLIFSSFDH